MPKSETITQINEVVDKTIKYIHNILSKADGVNQKIIEGYIEVLTSFKNDQNIETLLKYREIYNRASIEGDKTDYTEATSVNFEGEYTSLTDLFEEIERLSAEYYEFS